MANICNLISTLIYVACKLVFRKIYHFIYNCMCCLTAPNDEVISDKCHDIGCCILVVACLESNDLSTKNEVSCYERTT